MKQASKQVSTNTFKDVEIEPLTGKPFFHITMCRSHISSPYQLTLASEITRFLPQQNVLVTLTRGKRSWKMTYNGSNATHRRFDIPSWKEFVADNMLRVDDVCLFELVTCTDPNFKFKVQILRGDLPSLHKGDGSIGHPIVVD